MKRPQPSSAQHRLEVLYDVTRRLAAVHETEKILDLIVNAATRLLGVEAAALRLLDGDELVLRARTESAATLVARTRIHVGESLSGRVVATGEVVVVEDLVTDTRYDAHHKSAALALGYHGYLGVPLSAHGRIIGALNVYTTKQHRFEPDEIALVESFANQASLAIEQDRLLREARERASRLQSLARLNQVVSSSLDTTDVLRAIAAAAAQLTEASAVGCWIADAKHRVLERRAVSDYGIAADYPSATVAFGEGLIGSVATHRKALAQNFERRGNGLRQSDPSTRVRVRLLDLSDDRPPEFAESHQRAPAQQTFVHHLPGDGEFHQSPRGSGTCHIAVPERDQPEQALLPRVHDNFPADPAVGLSGKRARHDADDRPARFGRSARNGLHHARIAARGHGKSGPRQRRSQFLGLAVRPAGLRQAGTAENSNERRRDVLEWGRRHGSAALSVCAARTSRQ